MIFHPAIIALLLASSVATAMLVTAAPFALQIIRRWNLASGDERQLRLERRTYLFSTLAGFVMFSQLLALLLFVFNADKMAAMFVGAMCAVGTLNINGYGFPALIAQLAVFFLAAVWLVINHVDNQAPDYPLVRMKYALLLVLLPALALVLGLQLKYFLNLRADVITSCCGSLFSEDTKGVSGDMAALPLRPAMVGFYLAQGAAVVAALYYLARRRGGYWLAVTSLLGFVAAIAGIIAFVSLYVYEHPHHHCPFCLLKPEYDYTGYLLYLPLFIATAAGLGAGAIQPFRHRPSLCAIVPRVATRLAAIAASGFAIFTAVATALVANSRLTM